MNDLYQTTSARNHEQRQAWALLIQTGVLVPVERCKHKSIDYPNGRIDGHWVPSPNGTWCPGAGIGGSG